MWNDSRLEILFVSVGLDMYSHNRLTYFSFLKINLKSKRRPVICSIHVSNTRLSVMEVTGASLRTRVWEDIKVLSGVSHDDTSR